MTTKRIALALAALTLWTAGWAFSPPQDAEVAVHPVGGSVSMLEGKGGNVAVSAGPDGLLMVDNQFADMAPKLRAAMDGLSKAPLRFLVNTHVHGDHTGGNAVFGALAPIVAHVNVRSRLAESGDKPIAALPVVTFEDRLTLYVNGEEIEVRHVANAHTDGDSIVWFRGSNVLHLGDTFFHKRFPFIDLDSGGSVRGLTRVIGELLAQLPKDIKIIPGHGPLATLDDLAGYHAMLIDCQKLVADALAAGKDAKAMKEAKLLSKYDAYSWNFISAERFIDVLARDAQAK